MISCIETLWLQERALQDDVDSSLLRACRRPPTSEPAATPQYHEQLREEKFLEQLAKSEVQSIELLT